MGLSGAIISGFLGGMPGAVSGTAGVGPNPSVTVGSGLGPSSVSFGPYVARPELGGQGFVPRTPDGQNLGSFGSQQGSQNIPTGSMSFSQNQTPQMLGRLCIW